MGLGKIGKGGKSKNMAVKVRDEDDEELFDDERSKLKGYITRQFKKFIENANVKIKDKDLRRFEFASTKPNDKLRKEYKDAGQNSNLSFGPKYYGCPVSQASGWTERLGGWVDFTGWLDTPS